MMKKLCFSSFVFGNYQKFIPYYIYSIFRTYPESYVKVFYDGVLDTKIKNVLEYFKSNNILNFEIIELEDSSIKDFKKYKIKGGGKKLIRWLFDSSNFKNFEYVYFGDVDIIILPEEFDLLELHKKQMNDLDVPFSNKVRIDESGKPVKRLTGLHFIKSEEYFTNIDLILKRIKSDAEYRENYFSDISRDENFLYKLNKEAFQFDDDKLIKAIRPWHGVHLGITRGNKNINLKIIEQNSSLSIEEIKLQFTSMLEDGIFQKIIKEIFVIELYVILRNLNLAIPFRWKIEAFKYKLIEYKRDFKRKLKNI